MSPGRVFRHLQAAIADQSGAEQGGCFRIAIAVRQFEAVARIRHRVGRVTAIYLVAGEAWIVAEIFAARQTIGTGAIGETEPGHANAFANLESFHDWPQRLDPADDLMSQHQGQLWLVQLAIDNVQIGTAHTAGQYFEQDLIGLGLWYGQLRGL